MFIDMPSSQTSNVQAYTATESNHKKIKPYSHSTREIQRVLEALGTFPASVNNFTFSIHLIRFEAAAVSTLSSHSVEQVLASLEHPIHLPLKTQTLRATVEIVGWGKPTPVLDDELDGF